MGVAGMVMKNGYDTLWYPVGYATGYLFLLPWLVGFFCLTLGPTLSSLYLSFTDFNLLQSPRWIGLQNYVRMFFADPRFWGAVKVTLVYVALWARRFFGDLKALQGSQAVQARHLQIQ